MIKNSIHIYLSFFAFVFSESYIEVDLGHHAPQGSFNKYNNPGFSLRFSYSWANLKNPHLKYDFSIQYLQFKSESWLDNDVMDYPASVTNSEQSFGLLFGPRLMSPTKRGALRPYIGFKGGFFIFTETMSWEWEGDFDEICLLYTGFNNAVSDNDVDFDHCDNDHSISNTLESNFKLGAVFEMGANMKINDSWGSDFGVQYNIIPSLESYDSQIQDIQNDQEEDLSPILSVGQISKTINADYITFYIGCYFKIW